MYYTPGHFLKKSDTGGLVHHYYHPSAQFDGNYTSVQFDENYTLAQFVENPSVIDNWIPMYGCSLGAGKSGSAGEVRASAAKL